MNSQKENKTETKELEEALPKDEFSQEDYNKFWEEFLVNLKRKNEIILYNIFSPIDALVKENNIDIVFPSHSSQQEFHNMKEEFIQNLKKRMNNYSISFSFSIKESEKAFILTQKQIYEKMKEKEPLLEKIKTELGLDFN